MAYIKYSLALFVTLFGLVQAAKADTVYLTIDDGPLGGEFNIIKALEKEETHATFFLVGSHVEASSENKSALKDIKASPYVDIGNHSYSHAHNHYRQFYSSEMGVLQDMEKANEILGLTDKPYMSRLPGRDVFRLPGISRDDPFLTRSEDDRETRDFDNLYDHGFYLWGWDHEWAHESSGKPIQPINELVRQIKVKLEKEQTLTKGHLILLMHDEMFRDVFDGEANFSNLVIALKDAGFTLGRLKDYPIR